MPNEANIKYSYTRRFFFIILPLAYYFYGRGAAFILNICLGAGVLFLAYLKYYKQAKIKPAFLGNIFSPEKNFILLAAACFLAVFFFSRIIAITAMLYVVLANTAADMVKERLGRLKEIFVFAWVALSSSLFLLSFPLVLDWRIALFGCLSAVTVKLVKLPFNEDITVALGAGLTMRLLSAVIS